MCIEGHRTQDAGRNAKGPENVIVSNGMRHLLLLLPVLAFAVEPVIDAPKRPYLGIQLAEVDEALAYPLGLAHDLGVLVAEVQPGSPAEAMGLKRYDVIIKAGNADMYTPRALGDLVAGMKVGEAIILVVRRGADETSLSGTIGETEVAPPRWGGDLPDEVRERLDQLRRRPQPGLRHGDGDWEVLPGPPGP